jgi:hypothetical protein
MLRKVRETKSRFKSEKIPNEAGSVGAGVWFG